MNILKNQATDLLQQVSVKIKKLEADADNKQEILTQLKAALLIISKL